MEKKLLRAEIYIKAIADDEPIEFSEYVYRDKMEKRMTEDEFKQFINDNAQEIASRACMYAEYGGFSTEGYSYVDFVGILDIRFEYVESDEIEFEDELYDLS